MDKKPSNSELKLKEVAFMSLQVGFVVAITAVLFVLAGKWIDTKLGTHPIGVLLGIFLGFVVALFIVWQIVKPIWTSLNTPSKKEIK